MSIADRLRATSSRMIHRFGEDVTYKQIAESSYDPATGTSTPTSTSIPVKALSVASDSDYIIGENKEYGPSGQDLKSKLILYLAASDLGIVPQTNDLVTLRSADWQVVGVSTLAAAGQDVVYKLSIEK